MVPLARNVLVKITTRLCVVQPELATSEEDDFPVHSIRMSKDSAWYVNVQVCESVIKFKVDTGAETNTVPMNVWKRIAGKPTLMWSNVVLSVFGGGTVHHYGIARVLLQAGYQQIISELFVTSGRATPILGLKACLILGIVQAGDNHNPSVLLCLALIQSLWRAS